VRFCHCEECIPTTKQSKTRLLRLAGQKLPRRELSQKLIQLPVAYAFMEGHALSWPQERTRRSASLQTTSKQPKFLSRTIIGPRYGGSRNDNLKRLLLPRAGMALQVELPQSLYRQVRVYLRGRDMLVTQQFLHGPQIRAPVE